jgi:hypothetical protein
MSLHLIYHLTDCAGLVSCKARTKHFQKTGSTLARKLVRPLRENWFGPCEKLGSTLARKLVRPLRENWFDPCEKIGSALARKLVRPLRENWFDPCEKIGWTLGRKLVRPLKNGSAQRYNQRNLSKLSGLLWNGVHKAWRHATQLH